MPHWTPEDDVAGYRQGWGIFECWGGHDNGRLQIQALDDPKGVAADFNITEPVPTHDHNDKKAATFVQQEADKGDLVCRKAIEVLIEKKSRDVKRFGLKKNW